MDREKLKSHKARQLAAEGLNLNYIQQQPAKQQNYSQSAPKQFKKTAIMPHISRPRYQDSRAKGHNNKSQKHRDAVRKESAFLLKNKNVSASGKLIVPIDKIPASLKKKPNFNARTYSFTANKNQRVPLCKLSN